jgi:DNA invertase Pin-like site-specific DNA recombinase
MLVGYARVSTEDQLFDLQVDALKNKGCEKIFTDKRSGADDNRQGLKNAIDFCREGDTLVVYKLDRLGRGLRHLIETVEGLGNRGVHFISLDNNIDTTQATGKLLFHLVACFAEFERCLIKERTKAGLQSAKARGKILGRQIKITPSLIAKAGELYKQNLSISEICQLLKISRASYYKIIHPRLINRD